MVATLAIALALALAQAPVYAEPPPSPPREAAPTPEKQAPGPGLQAPGEKPTATPTPTTPPTPPPTGPPPPPPAELPPPPDVLPAPAPPKPPPPSTRYLEFSLGVAAPVGNAASNVTQADVYSEIVELEVQLAKRIGEHVQAGGYGGFGIGGVGTRAQRLCSGAEKDDCATMMLRAGLLLRAVTAWGRGSEPFAHLGLGARLDSADVPDIHGTEHARLAAGPELRVGVGCDLPALAPAPAGEGLGLGFYLDATLFQALGSDAIPELKVPGGRRPAVGWIGGGIRFTQR
jgi:hypothetical protein